MGKNLLWATLLSAAFLLGWYYLFPPQPLPTAGKTSHKELKSETPSSIKESQQEESSAIIPKKGTQAKKHVSAVEIERTLEIPNARIVIHSQGASVKHWWVNENKNSGDSAGSHTNWVDLVNHPDSVKNHLLQKEQYPLATFPELNFEEYKEKNRNAIQSCWRTVLPSGIEFEKKYFFEPPQSGENGSEHARFLKLTMSLRNPTAKPQIVENLMVGWGEGLGTIESEKKENPNLIRVLAYPSPTKEVTILKPEEQKSDYSWVAVDNRYYLLALLPEQGQFSYISVDKSKVNLGEVNLATRQFTLAPGERKNLGVKIYAGPKGYTRLKSWGYGLEHAVDFGYFGFLGKWALKAMDSLHRMTGNYGWSIVLLTCALQVIVFPLSLKSYKSTAEMKKLQPKIQEIQKRYKEEPQRMNQEMMALYKEAKTNPFGGCLPMILQIPIFWAFFTMLRNSYELRGSSWIFWIQDLSQKDPYYVLPIVMGGGMVLQQKITGPMGDPTQAKMMMFMPLIFTFMFLNFPSGLVLYWLTNSILSMSSQYWFTQKFGKSSDSSVHSSHKI